MQIGLKRLTSSWQVAKAEEKSEAVMFQSGTNALNKINWKTRSLTFGKMEVSKFRCLWYYQKNWQTKSTNWTDGETKVTKIFKRNNNLDWM
jgi:hypothetical protein